MSFNTNIQPKCYEVVVDTSSPYGGSNLITIPGVATYCDIINYGSSPIMCRLNGDPNATFMLQGESAQVWPPGACYITSIDFAATVSGMSNATVDIFVGVVPA